MSNPGSSRMFQQDFSKRTSSYEYQPGTSHYQLGPSQELPSDEIFFIFAIWQLCSVTFSATG